MSVENKWNSLEVVKLFISVLTPLLLFWLGILVSNSAKQTERAFKEIEQAKEIQRVNQLAVQNLAKSIYERRARAELLASSLKRNISIEEIKIRKAQYDEAYFFWNKDHQANLLLVRGVLGEKQYSDFESLIEFHMVGKIFSPLDTCLTKAYDNRLANQQSSSTILSECKVSNLLQQALDCGYALTDELFKLTEKNEDVQRIQATSIVSQRCPG